MRKIIISSGASSSVAYNQVYYIAKNNITNPAISFGSSSASYTRFQIMQGTVPTDFSTLTAGTSRSTDVLLSIPLTYGNFSIVSPYTSYIIDTGTSIISASTTGVATWFWLFGSNTSGTFASTVMQLIGTITPTGGGGDIELASVNIVAGNPFKLGNFTINVDTTYTY
jgi:hypothetical protein